MKQATIKDLAKYLSLSTSTISRALLNEKHIHPETRERVLEAVEKLGYKPNAVAHSLRYGHSKTIGFIVPEMVTPFSSELLRGIQKLLNPKGYKIIIMQSDEDPGMERQNLLLLESFSVDAIIINPCHKTYNEDIYNEIINRGMPLVFCDRIPGSSIKASKVIIDDYKTASSIVQHLVDTGKKRIAHIMGPLSIANAAERAKGYKNITRKHHIYDPSLLVKVKGLDFENGKSAIQQLVNRKVEFDAIFAFTDILAIGAMNYLLHKGYHIPQDVAIASFSGTQLSSIVYPQLTTVAQPLIKMGEAAAELVLEKIANKGVPDKTVLLEPLLVIRSSTGVIKE